MALKHSRIRPARKASGECEQDFRGLVDALPGALFVYSGDTILYGNESCARLLRAADASSLRGRKLSEILSPASLELLRFRSREGESRAVEEQRWKALDGSPLIVNTQVSPVRWNRRRATMVAVLSSAANAENALRESEARYRAFIENATFGIYRSHLNGAVLDVNPALISMLGHEDKQELLARNLRDIYAKPSDREQILKQQHQDLCKTVDVQVDWKRKDGSVFPVRLCGRATRGESEDDVQYEVIVEDLSKRRVLEDQLRQAQKMEAIGQLAGGVAHDFNNLIMIMSSYSELMLLQLEATSPHRRHAEQILNAARRAAGLTRQLLAFSRKQVLEPTILDLNEIVRGLERMLPRLIGEDVAVRVLASPELWKIKADRSQVEQVLLNLAANARDAMPNGGALIIETSNQFMGPDYARNHCLPGPGRYVLLAVSDTGSGMGSATLSHAFEPFFTTKERGKGTGMGLATVYGIVKQSGGSIWAYSELGQGTCFKIYLPARQQEPAEKASAQTCVPGAAASGTILLVEDEVALRESTREALEALGYRVLEARNGAHALELSRQQSFDLLLTDVIMPELSGDRLAHELCARQPGLKVLYVSGYTDNFIAHRGILESGAAFLQKPFSFEALANTILAVMAKPVPGHPTSAS